MRCLDLGLTRLGTRQSKLVAALKLRYTRFYSICNILHLGKYTNRHTHNPSMYYTSGTHAFTLDPSFRARGTGKTRWFAPMRRFEIYITCGSTLSGREVTRRVDEKRKRVVAITGFFRRSTAGERWGENFPLLGGVYASLCTPYLGVDCVRTRCTSGQEFTSSSAGSYG